MHNHARDGLRVAQSDVLELDVRRIGRQRIRRLPHAVAERARLPVVRFAGADVEHVRVGRRERQVADRSDPVRLEDRIVGRAVVERAPHASRREPDEILVRVLLVDGEIVDSAALAGRADFPPPEPAQRGMVRRVEEPGRRWRRGRRLCRRRLPRAQITHERNREEGHAREDEHPPPNTMDLLTHREVSPWSDEILPQIGDAASPPRAGAGPARRLTT